MEVEYEGGPGPEERTITNLGFLVTLGDGAFPHGTSGEDKIRFILWEKDPFRVILDTQRLPGDDPRGIIPIDTTPVTNPLMDAEAASVLIEGKVKLIPFGTHDDDDSDILDADIEAAQQAVLDDPPNSPASKINDVITKIIVNFDPEIMDEDLLEGKGLVGKLSKAIKNIDAGNDEDACNKLTKVVKQTNRLIDKTKIGQLLGDEIIADVEAIKLDLNCAQFS